MALITEGRYRRFEHNVIQSLETIKDKLKDTAANLDEITEAIEHAETSATAAESSAGAAAESAAASATAAGLSQTAAETAQSAAEAAAETAAADATTEAIATIEARAAEIEADWPADYSDLTGDVSDLRNDLTELDDSIGYYRSPTSSGATSATDNVQELLGGLSIANGKKYKLTVTLASAADVDTYYGFYEEGSSEYKFVMTLPSGTTTKSQNFNSVYDVADGFIGAVTQRRVLDYTVSFEEAWDHPTYMQRNEAAIEALSEEVDDAKDDIKDIQDMFAGDAETCKTQFWLYNSNWYKNGYNAAYLIPVNPGDEIRLIAQSGSVGYYSLLNTIDNMAAGNTPDYATGYSGSTSYGAGSITTVTVPSDGHYFLLYNFDGSRYYTPVIFTINGYPALNGIIGNIAQNYGSIHALQESTFTTYEIADGDLAELTPTIAAGSAISNVKFHTSGSIQKRKPVLGKIVAVNHDDLQASDYINTRKIYNKYGFNANYNLILLPFTSQSEIETKSANVRKMIADGNDLGLHAIMNCSFWWVNMMFDIRPDGTFTFAPTLSELTTVVADGKNAFGQTVDTTKPLSYYEFVGVPSAYANTAVANLTTGNYSEIIGSYTFLANTTTVTGLDLDGNSQTWTLIKWLEHWYNRLIDSTLGYSDLGTLSDLYENYEMPTGASYPDAAHLLSGKIVFFDDTDNPNYSDSDYQIVGRFSKGLYKGAASCCNYEIRDRLIKIARAFIKHYFGIDQFTSYGRHGVKYVDAKWWNDGVPYDNRDKTVLSSEHGTVYNSIKQRFETGLDVLLDNGIRMTGHNTPQTPVFIGQLGLYDGQQESHYPYFAHADVIDYLALAGNSLSDVTGTNVSDANLTKVLGEQDNLLKWAYEKSGQQVSSSDSSVSFYVLTDLQNAIDVIREKLPTGKIPMLSLDTIVQKATNYYALELLCQYCYQNGINIVPFETARQVAMSSGAKVKNNYFPNPMFESTALIMCGGSSTRNAAYRPDGWSYGEGNQTYSVATDDGHRVFSITAGSSSGNHFNSVEIWGLPAGEYAFSCYAKQTGEHGAVSVYKYANGSPVEQGSFVDQVEPGSTYQQITIPFTVPAYEHHSPDTTPGSQYSFGYENNVVMVKINVGLFGTGANSGEVISIYDPVIKAVNE